MRKITCNYELNKYTGVYIETILNGLSESLLSGLVRDVDSIFNNSKITLPVDKNGNIDFKWMEYYVKEIQSQIIKNIYQKYIKELKI